MKLRAFFGLLLLGALLALSAPDAQGSYPAGSYRVVDGYRLYDGYPGQYFYGSYVHYRTYSPGYYSYGYYYPGRYVYTYSHTYAAPTYSVQGVTYQTPDWRTALLNIAAARDKTELAIRKAAFEQAYFKEGVALLGLTGNFKIDGYGAAAPYPQGVPLPFYAPTGTNYGSGYGNLQLSHAGVNGSTIYGYSMNTISSVYGDANLPQLYQQAYRLAENVQRLSGDATTGFQGLVGQEGNNRAKIAEWLAKGQAAREFFKGLEGSGGTTATKSFSFKFGPAGNEKLPPPVPEPAPPAQVQPDKGAFRQEWFQSASKCVACHANGKKDGGFALETFSELSPEGRQRVISRLTTDDVAKMMPRNPDGGPGKRLTAAEIDVWRNVR